MPKLLQSSRVCVQLKERCFSLQLQETNGYPSLFTSCPDPALARKWFVGLCLYRFSRQMQQAIRKASSDSQAFPWGSSIKGFFNSVMMTIAFDPTEYPFCLSEREFTYYSKQNFGDTIKNVEGIYHPPKFYSQLGLAVAGVAIGAVASTFVAAAMPEVAATAGTLEAAAPGFARNMVSGTAGLVGGQFFGSNPFDAAKKDRLWGRYLTEYHRRSLR